MNKQFRFARVAALPVLAGSALVASPAFAAIDVAAATTGVSDAQTAVLAVLAAMIGMAAAVFGLRKVYSLMTGR